MRLGRVAVAASDKVKSSENERAVRPRLQSLARGPELCPVCNGASQRRFERRGYWIHECGTCGHRFAELEGPGGHVARTYGDYYFNGDPAGYPNYLEEGDQLVAHGRRYARLMNRYMKPGCLLDEGAAGGFVMKGFVELGWRAVGIEPNSGMADHAQNSLGLDVQTCTLEDFEPTDRFDLVSMIQVVPHFVDPRRALHSAAQITKPGGFWLIETWDRRSHMGRLMGDAWHEYNPPSVLHWFSRDSLTQLVSEFGFSEVASGRPRKWIGALHAKAVARASVGASALSKVLGTVVATIPGHLAIPYLGDDLYWVLFEREERGSRMRPIRGWA